MPRVGANAIRTRLDRALRLRAVLAVERLGFPLSFRRCSSHSAFWWEIASWDSRPCSISVIGLIQFTLQASPILHSCRVKEMANSLAAEFSQKVWPIGRGTISTHRVISTPIPGQEHTITIVDGSFEFKYPI
jgi:hypothetical protein